MGDVKYPVFCRNFGCLRRGQCELLRLPITEMIADCELSLPISPCLSQEQVDYVVDCINSFRG